MKFLFKGYEVAKKEREGLMKELVVRKNDSKKGFYMNLQKLRYVMALSIVFQLTVSLFAMEGNPNGGAGGGGVDSIDMLDIELMYTGKTGLHYAAQYNTVDAVFNLVLAGSDVNAKDAKGKTPLHYAAQFNTKEVVEILVVLGADGNAVNVFQMTPLHYAVERGDLGVIASLINIAKSNVNAADCYGMTPLHYAVLHGKSAVRDYLIAQGSDRDKVDILGRKPLEVTPIDVNAQLNLIAEIFSALE